MTFLLLPIWTPLILIVLCAVARHSIRQHATVYYVGTLLIALGTMYLDHLSIYKTLQSIPLAFPVYAAFKRGVVATSLFMIVMFVGAAPKTSWFYRMFLPIRGPLSIMAGILTFTHNCIYGAHYFTLLVVNPGKLSPFAFTATIITLILIAMLIPLFITSFVRVRKKMSYRTWKGIQRLAYPFFILIYVHVMVLYIGGYVHTMERQHYFYADMYLYRMIFYTVVFGTYGVMRWCRYKKDKRSHSMVAN